MKKIKHLLFLLFLVIGLPQGNFQILNIPPSTKLLALSNSGQAINDNMHSYNPASIKSDDMKIAINSHVYPKNILYTNSQLLIPKNNTIYSLQYANLNFGTFVDGSSKHHFNCSEFLFQGSIKQTVLNRFSIGSSIGYAINKISNEFSHALFLSLGVRSQMNNPYLGVGLSMNNIGKVIKNFHNTTEYLPTSITLSTFYQPKYFPGILLIDFYNNTNINETEIRLGLELEFKNYISLRFGNSSNSLALLDAYSSYFTGFSAGIGINMKKWDIDIGVYNLETAGIVSGISLLYNK